jgi:hypothetical protein
MEIFEQVSSDLRSAQRERDAGRLRVLRTLVSQIKYEAKENGSEIDDSLVARVVQRDVRRRNEAVDIYTNGDRPIDAANERFELSVIQAYLPPEVDRDAIVAMAREVINEVGASGPQDMGKVMGPLIARLRENGSVDGQTVNTLVAGLLNNE